MVEYKKKDLEQIIKYVKGELEKYEHCFIISSIFPFYLHGTRVDINQVQILELYGYIDKGLADHIKKNGLKVEEYKCLYSL